MNSRFRLLPVSRRHFIQRSGGIAAGAVLASGLIRPRRVEAASDDPLPIPGGTPVLGGAFHVYGPGPEGSRSSGRSLK